MFQLSISSETYTRISIMTNTNTYAMLLSLCKLEMKIAITKNSLKNDNFVTKGANSLRKQRIVFPNADDLYRVTVRTQPETTTQRPCCHNVKCCIQANIGFSL